MSTRRAGVLVLIVATALLLVAAAIRTHQTAGSPISIVPPPPPAVGTCLDQGREPVECAATHRWEVVAAWPADDPRRPTEATTDACEQTAGLYSAIARAQMVGDWIARATVVSALLDAPADQRAGPYRGWTACGVQPAWVDQRTGAIAGARSVADMPDLFGLCLGVSVDTGGGGGSNCLSPHDVQVLGSWNNSAAVRALDSGAVTVQQMPPTVQSAAARSCLTFASTMTGVADPTYGGRLDYLVVVQQGNLGRPQVNCLATPTGGRVLVGSITALGDRPVPLR